MANPEDITLEDKANQWDRIVSSNDSTEIARSWLLKISTKRDICVPLKSCGSRTYMLKSATVG